MNPSQLMNYHFRSVQEAVWQPIKSLGIGSKTWQIFRTAPKYHRRGVGTSPVSYKKRRAASRCRRIRVGQCRVKLGTGVPEVEIGCR